MFLPKSGIVARPRRVTRKKLSDRQLRQNQTFRQKRQVSPSYPGLTRSGTRRLGIVAAAADWTQSVGRHGLATWPSEAEKVLANPGGADLFRSRNTHSAVFRSP